MYVQCTLHIVHSVHCIPMGKELIVVQNVCVRGL